MTMTRIGKASSSFHTTLKEAVACAEKAAQSSGLPMTVFMDDASNGWDVRDNGHPRVMLAKKLYATILPARWFQTIEEVSL